MIELRNLTKQYGNKNVVNNISLHIHPGVVTGFLGPNGAGKTTTMRMILGLAAPTAGNILIDKKAYASLKNPLYKIGAMMDTNAIDARLTAWQHLAVIAAAAGINSGRVEEVLLLTGLREAANKKIREFSFGMKQRLGIAAALLGNPETVMMDEPFNGLDIEGIHWLRSLLQDLAKQGKAVLVSSHLLSEVQEVADRVIVLARGELIADMNMEEMQKESFHTYVQVASSNTPMLKKVLDKRGAKTDQVESGFLYVRKMDARKIGELAFENGICIYELTNYRPSLEQLFSELVDGKTDYKGLELNSLKEV